MILIVPRGHKPRPFVVVASRLVGVSMNVRSRVRFQLVLSLKIVECPSPVKKRTGPVTGAISWQSFHNVWLEKFKQKLLVNLNSTRYRFKLIEVITVDFGILGGVQVSDPIPCVSVYPGISNI